MPKCVYCGKVYGAHKGVTLVKLDGSINFLCSAKCRKNKSMKRRKVRWISKTKKVKEKIAKPEAKSEVKEEAKEEEKIIEEEVKEEAKVKAKSEVKEEAKRRKEINS